MTPAQIQQKLNDIRNKKAQMDAKVSAMADKVNKQIEPLDGYRSKMMSYWGKWKSKNHIIMKERTVGKDKGKFMIRRSWSLVLPKDVKNDYLTAWRGAPDAIKAITEMLEDLYKTNRDLQQVKRNLLAVVIPNSISNASELTQVKSRLDAVERNTNQAMDRARKILKELPARAKRVEPVMRVLFKYLVVALIVIKAERNRLGDKRFVEKGSKAVFGKDKEDDKNWEDWKLTKAMRKSGESIKKGVKKGVESVKNAREAISRQSRYDYLSGLIPVLEGFVATALEYTEKAVEFIRESPAREQEIAKEQTDFKNKISEMKSVLSITTGGSSNRSEAGSGDAILHVLAIGAVAMGICAFDHYERRT